jgi:hypothetical protein
MHSIVSHTGDEAFVERSHAERVDFDFGQAGRTDRIASGILGEKDQLLWYEYGTVSIYARENLRRFFGSSELSKFVSEKSSPTTKNDQTILHLSNIHTCHTRNEWTTEKTRIKTKPEVQTTEQPRDFYA